MKISYYGDDKINFKSTIRGDTNTSMEYKDKVSFYT